MIFRAFWGEPVPEARELEEGHLHHAEVHVNPATGEEEDTDVGFPGPEHHIAERVAADEASRWACWPSLATIGGIVLIPNDDDVARHVPRADVRGLERRSPTRATALLGLRAACSAPALGLAGHRARLPRSGCRRPGTAAAVRERFAPRCTAVRQQVVLRRARSTCSSSGPFAWFGRFGQQTFERIFVNGTLVGGTTGHRARRLGRRARRRSPASCAPTRRCSCSALVGVGPLLPAAVVVTLHLSILLWLPARARRARRCCCRARGARWLALAGALATLAYAIALVVDFDSAARGPAVRHRRDVDLASWASTTSSASTG